MTRTAAGQRLLDIILGMDPQGLYPPDPGNLVEDMEREAGHRVDGWHSCFSMNCAGMVREIDRLRQALRVASHANHNQDGQPVEGFPVCSECGAIQTDMPSRDCFTGRHCGHSPGNCGPHPLGHALCCYAAHCPHTEPPR